ncbi:hypothetical protein ACGFYP_06735 [Streptomyces sp. NPDC048370]|uniref:hypothetical protein n=1 Tax=Streptomyces sp. NPDC048370 TaxID=3365540 RepID=UPI00371921BF
MGKRDRTDAFLHSLDLAERQLAIVHTQRATLRAARLTRAVSGLVAGLALGLALAGSGGGDAGTLVPLIVAAAALGVVAVSWIGFIRPSLLRIAAAESAMLYNVNRLREVFSHLADQAQWDPALIKSVRGRLSRFPIEGGSFR